MLKKTGVILLKIAGGLFIFYLVIGFVLIPLVLSWGIKSQGTKLLRHPVSVKTVQFNPFLWSLDIYGLEIKDDDGHVMAGWARFGVDVSFVRLLKKEYRVESVILDGLAVNAVLEKDGTIDIMALVPPATEDAPPQPKKEASAGAGPALPLVIVDDVSVTHGRIRFTDQSISPYFSTNLSGMTARVSGLSTDPASVARLHFETGLDDKGRIQIEAGLRPFVQPLELETTLSVDSYALAVLTPYTGKYTARELEDGKLDLKITYRIADNRLTASHRILIQKFEFGKKVESPDALNLPFGLAVALLEDAQKRINISLPVTGDMSQPDFHYWSLIGQVARNFFMGLVTKPFSFLGSMLGADAGTEDLGSVRFPPGTAELPPEEQAKITALVQGLRDRPRLLLQINGGYDPVMDWKAIKEQALNKEYQELRSQSSKSDSWIYELIFQRHFGLKDLWAVTRQFQGSDQEKDLVDELKRQLIENAPANKGALEALARERAGKVKDFILKAGFEAHRLRPGTMKEVLGGLGVVPLEFVLTIFDDQAPEAVADPADDQG